MNIVNNVTSYVPREVSTATIGVTLAAASGVAIQIIATSSKLFTSNVMRNFLVFSCGAAGIIGTVMTVYSMIHSCQKIISEKNELPKSITVTVLGGLSSALIETIGEHFWKIAPSFYSLNGQTMVYAIATNFAWQASLLAGVGGLIFTAYAAYRLGIAAINQARA